MAKGKYAKKSAPIWPIFLICALILLALAALFLLPGGGEDAGEPSAQAQTTACGPVLTGESGEAPHPSRVPESSKPTGSRPGQTQPEETQKPQPPQTDPTTPTEAVEPEALPEYESWLAAAVVVGISMEYPDFQVEGIWAASETGLEEKAQSRGVYVIFTSGGSRMAIHSAPLRAERTEKGTFDLSTLALGFATFDRVAAADIDTSKMTAIPLEVLGGLIAQSVMVSVYEH